MTDAVGWVWIVCEPPKGEPPTYRAVYAGYAVDEFMAGASARHALKYCDKGLRAYAISPAGKVSDVTEVERYKAAEFYK
jgi:hypothetical protein